MRPIDADALPVHKAYCVDEAGWGANFYVVDKSDIDNAPTIDAVPVVRCKDCKHSMLWRKPTDKAVGDCIIRKMHSEDDWFYAVAADDFCSYGERREEEE